MSACKVDFRLTGYGHARLLQRRYKDIWNIDIELVPVSVIPVPFVKM